MADPLVPVAPEQRSGLPTGSPDARSPTASAVIAPLALGRPAGHLLSGPGLGLVGRRLVGAVGPDDSGDDLRTDSARLLGDLLLDQEEHRPVAGALGPPVWLARVCEQLALAAVGVDHHARAFDAGPEGESSQVVEARQLTAVKLLVLAGEAIGALVELKPAAASRAESKLRAVRAIDEAVEEKLRDEREMLGRRSPAEWVAAVAELLGGAAAAVSVLDDEHRELPDPRDSGAIFLEGRDPVEAFCQSMLSAAVYATLACEFLYPLEEE